MSAIIKNTTEIKGGSAYQAIELTEVGQSGTIFIQALGKRNSLQYGDFFVFEGITGNIESLDELAKSLKPVSFKLNTVLQNAWENGSIQLGKMYRFTLVLKRGDKYQDTKTGATKQAKANNFKIEEIVLSDGAIKILKAGAPKKQKLEATSLTESNEEVDEGVNTEAQVVKPVL